MFFHLDDRVNFRKILVFLLFAMVGLVILGYKPLVSRIGQGTFVYFGNPYFGPGFRLRSASPCFSCT